MPDYNRVILTTGDTLASTIDGCPDGASTGVILMVSRREIESGLTGDAIDRLLTLSDSTAYTRRFAGKLMLSVDGYDADPRELHEIPQCRDFFRTVTAAWPFWFHFAEREIAGTSTLAVIATLLIDMEVLSRTGGGVSSAIKPESLKAFFDRQFAGLNTLYEFHGFSDEENLATTTAVLASLDRMFQPPADPTGAA